MRIPAFVVLIACALLAIPARAEEALDPAAWRRGPRLGLMLGTEAPLRPDRDSHTRIRTLRLDAEVPLLEGRSNSLIVVGSLSYSRVRGGRPDGEPDLLPASWTSGWFNELRLVPALRWSGTPMPHNEFWLDLGAGAFWADRTPSVGATLRPWDRQQLGAIAKVAVGLGIDLAPRSRLSMELDLHPHFVGERVANVSFMIGYSRRLR